MELREAAMDNPAYSLKYIRILVVAFCLIFAGAACAPPGTQTPVATPILQTVEVTREVTRIVEVPVTVTPAATLQPAIALEAMPGLAGKWIDPDSRGGGTVSTIVWQNGTYVVTSVVNSNRGGNELKTSSWSNGVLTWEYCPALQQHCLVQNTVSLNGDILTVNWDWFGGGHPGTSELQRQP
jgi:hypothetical protein